MADDQIIITSWTCSDRRCPFKVKLFMIQTWFNSLFYIRCNGVQNLKMFIGHLASLNTWQTILKCKFWKKFLVYTYMVVRRYCQNKLWASICHCLGSMFINQCVSQHKFHYIIAFPTGVFRELACDYVLSILSCRQPICDGLRYPQSEYVSV